MILKIFFIFFRSSQQGQITPIHNPAEQTSDGTMPSIPSYAGGARIIHSDPMGLGINSIMNGI